MIRPALAADFPRILELNADEVRQTSPLDEARLAELDALSALHWVVLREGSIEGFLLAMGENAGYRNDNFDWFAQRYQRFLYVDRIVINRRSAGGGLGRALYAALFAHARAARIDSVVCEINLDPPNPASIAFHARHGFVEVGQQQLAAAGKRVSMQRAPTEQAGVNVDD